MEGKSQVRRQKKLGISVSVKTPWFTMGMVSFLAVPKDESEPLGRAVTCGQLYF